MNLTLSRTHLLHLLLFSKLCRNKCMKVNWCCHQSLRYLFLPFVSYIRKHEYSENTIIQHNCFEQVFRYCIFNFWQTENNGIWYLSNFWNSSKSQKKSAFLSDQSCYFQLLIHYSRSRASLDGSMRRAELWLLAEKYSQTRRSS